MSTGKAREEKAYQVADRLHSAAIRLLRRLRLQDKASGVGPAQLSALSVLVFAGRPLSLGELAEAEQVKLPTMSRIVAGMVRVKLAKCEASKQDRRRLVISPTAKGTAILQAGRQRRVQSLASALEGFSASDLAELGASAELLFKIIERVRTYPPR
jgi:DNA-binding MarR family transcriptional regulator